MKVSDYTYLKEHVGHNLACVLCGDTSDPSNVAIKCETCNLVLFSYDKEENSSRYKTREDLMRYPYISREDAVLRMRDWVKDITDDTTFNTENRIEWTGKDGKEHWLRVVEDPEEDYYHIIGDDRWDESTSR